MTVTTFPIRHEIYSQLPGPMHHSVNHSEGSLIAVA